MAITFFPTHEWHNGGKGYEGEQEHAEETLEEDENEDLNK